VTAWNRSVEKAEPLAFAETRRNAGQEFLKEYTVENITIRAFCSNSGSSLSLFSSNAPGDLVEIALGCIYDDVPINPDAHICPGSGTKWAAPDDGLPQYAAGRDRKRIK